MIPIEIAEERMITAHAIAESVGSFDDMYSEGVKRNEFFYGTCSLKFLMKWYIKNVEGLSVSSTTSLVKGIIHWPTQDYDITWLASHASNELFTWWEDSGVFLRDNVWEMFNDPYEPKTKNYYFHFRYAGVGQSRAMVSKFRSPTSCLFPPCAASYSPMHEQPKYEDLEYPLSPKDPRKVSAARYEHTCPECGFKWGMVTALDGQLDHRT
tara:strand:+ start:858 stop:1487 length:630 start_codon:yes stop_codon:yes gene_type:complete